MRIATVATLVFWVSQSFVSLHAETPELWSQTYGSLDDEVATGLIVRSDGSIAVNALKTIYDDASRNLFKSQTDAWLFGLTEDGKLTWERTHGGTGSDSFYAAAVGPNSGLLLCGSTKSGRDHIEIWAASTDAHGTLQEQKTIPGDDDIAVNSGCSFNDRLFVCGQEWAGVGKKWQAFVTALTEEFEVVWKLSMGENEFDAMNQIVCLRDGNLLCLGKLGTESGFTDLLLLVNPQGKEVWRKQIPREDGHYRTTVVATEDGGFLTLGHQQTDHGKTLWMQKFDSFADSEWKKYFPSMHSESINAATLLSDGNVLIAGSRESSFPDGRRKFNATLMKLSEDGDLQWLRSFPSQGQSHIYSMAELPNEVIVAAGSIMPPNRKNADAWVFTLTATGNVPETVAVTEE